MSIALIRDICAAPVNIYTITTNCSSPKKQNSKKKKKKAFTFLPSFISLTNTQSSFLGVFDGPDPNYL